MRHCYARNFNTRTLSFIISQWPMVRPAIYLKILFSRPDPGLDGRRPVTGGAGWIKVQLNVPYPAFPMLE